MYLNNAETIVIEALPRKIIMINLVKNKERKITSFKAEDCFGTLRLNETSKRIYCSTIRVRYKRTLFEKYRDKSLPPSTFRILDFDGKTLKKAKFNGIYLDIQISNDEQILFTNSGTDFNLYRIK